MNSKDQLNQNSKDPLGLRTLAPVEPGYDGWSQIASALQEDQGKQKHLKKVGGWLALAASLVIVMTFALDNRFGIGPAGLTTNPVVTNGAESTSLSVKGKPAASDLEALISLSQNMETQIKTLRSGNGSTPAESVVYTAEMEDLIAQVDNELSITPDSVDLWGQRVNLLLDLARIYQQQWQIDYGRMASL